VAYEVADTPEVLDSPRLAALVKEIEAGDTTAALAKFWKEVQDHAPLVEPLVGNATTAHMSWVTFLFHGDAKTRAVSMFGGPLADSGDGRGVNFMRLRDTDVWYRTVRMPNDARFVYAYEINLSGRLPDHPDAQRKLWRTNDCPDVLNPKFIDTAGANLAVYSLLEMPEAPPQPYIHANPDIPAGKLTHHKIKSDILNEARTYSVYTPPGSDQIGDPRAQGASAGYPLVVLFDGDQYSSDDMIPGPTIVDNLIAAKKIPPVVVAFVDQIDRAKDLNCSKEFAAFVATELVPRVRSEQHASTEARRTTVGGSSLGGVMAAYCALEHPTVFGNVLSQSGAYWVYPGALDGRPLIERPGGTLIDEFVKRPKVPVRFYLEAGKFEDDLPCSLLAENRRLRDVLRAKGYEVTYSEFSGVHHFTNWRGTFSDALIAVTR
jgi:enterochelin esterase family protein